MIRFCSSFTGRLLRPFGIKISARAGGKRFDEEVRSSCNRHDALYIGVAALLDTLARVEVELAGLDKKVQKITASSKPCWHLMSVPGVGPLTSLAFVATVETRDDLERADPSNRPDTEQVSVGRSGCEGSICKQGDDMLRLYLYEAAGCLLTTVIAPSALRSWGLKLAKRLGPKRANGGRTQIGGPAAWALEEGGSFPRRAERQGFSFGAGFVKQKGFSPQHTMRGADFTKLGLPFQ
ncbi:MULTISPECIES: hypothetical protein [unclassified Mesorhizobium]|uniref:hypothetical protein n=1 Tax=unclassified Mesorhizobium TaxID=325217 RepID=UPI0003CEE3DC|nr:MULTISPECIES: hypothetical protein [unclassified Mesorhizobium]ESY10709.1 hypothetical protein X751_30665 [Mesorhizobium sp. LNJC395A00]WJI74838.1 hypothetical protein NLY37_28640 [Mesorhizobium sp. C395A]